MAIVIKNLGEGQIGPTDNVVYDLPGAVPAGKAWIVKNVRLLNTDTVARTINLYFLKSGGSTPRQISPKDMVLGAGQLAIDDQEITLGPGDKIQGKASSGNKIDYVMSGVERDVS
jgi:hypothetical protein